MIEIQFNSCETTLTDSHLLAREINTTLFQEIQAPVPAPYDVCSINVYAKYNCCQEVEFKFAPKYPFGVAYDDDVTTGFSISGIAQGLVKKIELYIWEGSPISAWVLKDTYSAVSPQTTLSVSILLNAQRNVSPGERCKFELETFCGHKYTIEFYPNIVVGDAGNVTGSNITVTAPTDPTEIVFGGLSPNETARFLPETFGWSVYQDGVYMVSVEKKQLIATDEITVTESWNHTIFRDCVTKCRLQVLAMKCETSIPFFQWQTLMWNAECRNLPYKDMCELWTQVDYAINNNCKPKKDCNCG